MNDTLGLEWSLWEIVVRSAIIYVVIVGGMRLTGRRQLGQMNPLDLVLILLIANAVQNAMVGADVTIAGGVVAAATLLIMNYLAARVTERYPRVEELLEGDPVVLINNGRFVDDHIRQQRLTRKLVEQQMREHGFDEVSAVHSATLEVDGTISFIPAGAPVVRTRRRVRAIRPGGG